MFKWLLLLLLFPSIALSFTGKWQEHERNKPLDRIIKSQFKYVNEQKVRFVSNRSGSTVTAVGVRPGQLKPRQIQGMKEVFGIVPLEPLSAIKEIEGGYKISYGEKERVVLLADYLPVQYADKPDTPPVVMVEVQEHTLIVETIFNNGSTALEVYQLIPNKDGLLLSVTTTVHLMKFLTPLVVERMYVPWSAEPEKSYVK